MKISTLGPLTLGMVLLLFVSACASTGVSESAPFGVTPPDDDEVAYRLLESASRHYLEGSYPRVIAHLESYLALEPESNEPWLHYILFQCYMQIGDYAHAYSLAQRILKHSPHDPRAFTQVGLAQLWLGKSKEAASSFEKAQELGATASPMNAFYASIAYERIGDGRRSLASAETAEKDLEEILLSNPTDVRAAHELAQVYLYWEKKNERVAQLLKAIRQGLSGNADEDIANEKPLFAKYYVPLLEGMYLSQLGAAKESNEMLLSALTNAPNGVQADLAEIYYYLARNFAALKERDSAASFLAKAAEVDPNTVYQAKIKKLSLQLGVP